MITFHDHRRPRYPQRHHTQNHDHAGSHGGLAFATVHLARNGNATTFHVHGGGLILGRLVNEFAIARTVTAAIRQSLGSAPAS